MILAAAAVDPAAARASRIELYRAWIASHGPATPHLFVAWFNLGAELCSIGDVQGAMLAFRNVLMLSPHFEAAALNLARLLEADGRVKQAIDVLDGALQPDEERIGLINQRARLLEKNKRLQEAEQELLKSLMIQPNQPDVIQHWLHVRQKMCCWGMLSARDSGSFPRQYGPPRWTVKRACSVRRRRATTEDQRCLDPAEDCSPSRAAQSTYRIPP